MEIISQIISFSIQTAICSYFLISLSKMFNKQNYSKKEIIITIIFSLIGTISSTLVKDLFPFANTLLGCSLMYINLLTILRNSRVKSFFIVLSCFILLGISELFVLFVSTMIFPISPEEMVQNTYLNVILISLQLIVSVFITNIIKMIFERFTNIKNLVKGITTKQFKLFAILLCICILPQLLFFMFNSYDYSWKTLLFDAIQIVLIGVIILVYFNTSVEKEKVQEDLVKSELHNKNIQGLVDGLGNFKHDYNNTMQSLNGYLKTKEYDKMQDHINKIIKECNTLNTLAKIDPKIFGHPSIYGIVGAKYAYAIDNDINAELAIMSEMSDIQFPMPELSRILGILLDNAIEATSKLEKEKQYIKLEVKFDRRWCSDIIRVINTYDTTININLEEIYKRNYSTKKKKSGIGLWEAKKIISKVPNSQIYPTIEKGKFIQNIIIEKE